MSFFFHVPSSFILASIFSFCLLFNIATTMSLHYIPGYISQMSTVISQLSAGGDFRRTDQHASYVPHPVPAVNYIDFFANVRHDTAKHYLIDSNTALWKSDRATWKYFRQSIHGILLVQLLTSVRSIRSWYSFTSTSSDHYWRNP